MNEHVPQHDQSVTANKKSFCRICTGMCGTVVSLDKNERVVAVHGDRDDPQSLGFICSKGANAPEAHNHQGRLLHPLKKMPDGSFERISLEQALAEIGEKLAAIYHRHGAEAIATYRGSGCFFSSICLSLVPEWMAAIGSPKLFSTLTIDQSAKVVAPGRIGYWPPGPQNFQDSDVTLLIGSNPLVSIANLDMRNPLKRMKDAKARGMTLIVIDPRRTETAQFADIFLQPLPGTDGFILAAMVRLIIDEHWYDEDFCARHVGDLAQLRAAVEPFTLDQAAAIADVPAALIAEAARAFARDGTRGSVRTGTGPDMGAFSNLAEHLAECLNILCGRLIREGEAIPNAGFLMGRGPRPAQVIPAQRPWEQGPKSRIGGYGLIAGEMVTAVLADEILEPGPGQIRFLLNHGGNPTQAIPNQRKVTKALESLELMVSIEPHLTPSARLSDYILPPKLQYERADFPIYIFEPNLSPTPYTRYTPPLAKPPEDADVCDEWYVLWALAKALGKPLTYMGQPLDMAAPPTEDELMRLTARNAPAPFDDIAAAPLGYFLGGEPQYALPADPATAGRFALMPADVQEELEGLWRERESLAASGDYPFRLANRRNRHRFNSMGFTQPRIRKLIPFNPAYMNPADMAELSIAAGQWIRLSSPDGAIQAIAEPDDAVRRGVVSMSHGFGDLPDSSGADGVCVNQLTTTDSHRQTINAMPRMTGIPVAVAAV
ncbi:MAG: molybdopterin-dependent oxidoreductase [Porticoccaceae bacterium]